MSNGPVSTEGRASSVAQSTTKVLHLLARLRSHSRGAKSQKKVGHKIRLYRPEQGDCGVERLASQPPATFGARRARRRAEASQLPCRGAPGVAQLGAKVQGGRTIGGDRCDRTVGPTVLSKRGMPGPSVKRSRQRIARHVCGITRSACPKVSLAPNSCAFRHGCTRRRRCDVSRDATNHTLKAPRHPSQT